MNRRGDCYHSSHVVRFSIVTPGTASNCSDCRDVLCCQVKHLWSIHVLQFIASSCSIRISFIDPACEQVQGICFSFLSMNSITDRHIIAVWSDSELWGTVVALRDGALCQSSALLVKLRQHVSQIIHWNQTCLLKLELFYQELQERQESGPLI